MEQYMLSLGAVTVGRPLSGWAGRMYGIVGQHQNDAGQRKEAWRESKKKRLGRRFIKNKQILGGRAQEQKRKTIQKKSRKEVLIKHGKKFPTGEKQEVRGTVRQRRNW